MLFNVTPQVTTLVIFVTLLSIYSIDVTSARTINDRHITEGEAEIRLGFDGDDRGFERFSRPSNDAFENQLRRLLLLTKVSYICKDILSILPPPK